MPEDHISQLLSAVNAKAPEHGRCEFVEELPFGAQLRLERYRLANGLDVLLLQDDSAPVIAYHTWFRVGSRHEKPGKTGLAHLFEHLMFNEVEGLAAGDFDLKMEEAGADNNASTWLDFTQYQESFPRDQIELVVDLEARRMNRLVLQESQVVSEKEVVANERRYRVDDDVEGTVDELLWKTAFQHHPYHWPTIGWMQDIESFSTSDCELFYRTFYAPNNATLVVVGDFSKSQLLELVSQNYGTIASSIIPWEDLQPEPAQTEERTVETLQPTPTQKVSLGFKGPALGEQAHIAAGLLMEILAGGRASRLHRKLVGELGLASEVRGFVGPHRDPSLIEIYASAREAASAEQLLTVIDEELEAVKTQPVSDEELARAVSRSELGLLSGLETADGKASTIGFFETVLRDPGAPFSRLRAMAYTTPSDLLRAARSYLRTESRTVVMVRRAEDR